MTGGHLISFPNASVLVPNIPDLGATIDVAKLAEELGFRKVWVAETTGLDAAAVGAVIALETTLEVGTAIVPVYSRTPAVLAMMAASWARIGDRPVHLGIGAGGTEIVMGWHGVPQSRPAETVRDTLRVLRQALSGEPTSYQGETRRSSGFRLALGPASSVRVYIGGMGPQMVALAAAEADGLILAWASPGILAGMRPGFDRLIADSGRAAADVRLVARMYTAVTDDPGRVRAEVRRELVEYLASPGYARFFAATGFGGDADAVAAAVARRDRPAAVSAVSDRLLDELLVVSDGSHGIRPRLNDFLAAGADEIMIQPVPQVRGGDPLRTLHGVAAALKSLR